MADERISKITRIYQDDDQNSDVWVDIERIVEMTVTGQQVDGFGLQEFHYIFDWKSFDPKDTRFTDHKEIAEPDDTSSEGTSSSNGTSSGNTIRIPIRRQVDVQDATFLYHLFFDNNKDNETRETHTKRVYHYDIPKDALDANGQPPSNPEDYKSYMTEDAKDESQFIDVEIIDKHVLEQNKGQTYSKKNWAQNINAILSEGL